VISQTQPETNTVFSDKAREVGSPILFADKIYSVSKMDNQNPDWQSFELKRQDGLTLYDIRLDLNGFYQKYNLPGVLLALDILIEKGYKISDNHIREGLASTSISTGLLGRWQKLHDKPLIICDTGHNVDGITQVLEQISRVKYEKLHIVIGMVGDKNIDGVLCLLPKDAIYYFTKAAIPRALDENMLAQKATIYGLIGNSYPAVNEALDAAKENAKPNDLIFIGGSTFVVAEVV